jgi:hypothetical protein
VIFIESSSFTRSIVDYLRDDHYRELQQVLVQNPAAGAVMPGCGGIKKDPFQRSAAGQREQGRIKSHLSLSSRTKLGFLTGHLR